MKVSVVIPCYNYRRFLYEAVESCVNQTLRPHEIIIVDDASTDNTQNLALDLVLTSILPVKLKTHSQNKGGGASRNTGIKHATGDYILLLDADDYVHPKFIENTLGLNDIVSSWVQMVGTANRDLKFKPNPTLEDFKVKNQITNTTLFKKEIWTAIGGFDESLIGLEDWDFWLRAVKKGYDVTVVQEFLSYYRRHSTESRNHTSRKHYKELSNIILNKS